ncbi:MAG: DUF4360 domain-containing protein [Oligoflexia bacterium]|nr:DUF4360 domain-containing protein [Oligoflexia bacterium]
MGRKPPETAEPDFALGEISLAGTGCPDGLGAVEVSRDHRDVRIRFEQMGVEAGGTSGKALDRKNCSATIQVGTVPEGFRVVISEVTLEGAYELQAGATGRVAHETFLAGTEGDKLQQDLGSEGESAGRIQLQSAATASTGCGEGGILRTHTSIFVRGDRVQAGVGSNARISELALKLKLVSCR